MDKKISELPAATSVTATDVLPLVTGGVNKKVSVATLARSVNTPVFSDIVYNPLTPLVYVSTIQLTADVVSITDNPLHAYTISAGTPGQSITIFATEATSVVYPNSLTTNMVLSFTPGGIVDLVYIGGMWRVKYSNGITTSTAPI